MILFYQLSLHYLLFVQSVSGVLGHVISDHLDRRLVSEGRGKVSAHFQAQYLYCLLLLILRHYEAKSYKFV